MEVVERWRSRSDAISRRLSLSIFLSFFFFPVGRFSRALLFSFLFFSPAFAI